MPPLSAFRRLPGLVASAVLIAACSGSSNKPPVAQGLTVSMQEDSSTSGTLQASDPDGNVLRYFAGSNPSHGRVLVDRATGAFTYTPDHDYFGSDSFIFVVSDGEAQSAPVSVNIAIQNVYDPPELGAIPDMQNSAETRDLVYILPATNVDRTPLSITASSDKTDVATVNSSDPDLSITLSPGVRGTATIHVSISDGQTSVERSFSFSVGDVTKAHSVATSASAGEAILLVNTIADPVTFTLEHNGFPTFLSEADTVAYVRAMPPAYPDEPFEHKLWRFVRNSVYHNVPLSGDRWLQDPWVTVGSLGWGFCSDTTASYVRLARAAGYEARTWGLTGHVVPEIKIGDRWEVFDADLAVYYHTAQGQIAGVAELESDPSLITSPVDALFAGTSYMYPYSELFANFYGTTADNFIGDGIFLPKAPAQYQPLILPGGSRLTYPGRWSTAVIGVDGTVPYAVPYFLQASLVTSASWTGTLPLPWMLWEVRGQGRVKILGVEYDVGSQELADLLLLHKTQIPAIEILSATTDLQLIFFVNAMHYRLTPVNDVRITGKDVWAISMGTDVLPEEVRVDSSFADRYRKPVAEH